MRWKVRAFGLRQASAVVGSRFVFPWALNRYRRMRHKQLFSERVVRQLENIRPDALWCTVWGLRGEEPYVYAARDLGIPVYTTIVGFDNPLTLGIRPRFDEYFVWNDLMNENLHRIEPTIEDRAVHMTGTSQFDFHRMDILNWSRRRTTDLLGLPPKSRFFLYGASHASHTPGEPALIRRIAAAMGQDEVLGGHHLVVRLHPFDDPERWFEDLEGVERVHVCQPFRPPCNGLGWTVSSIDDQGLLVNSLRHADGCINIASTIALDSAIMDCPVIAIDLRDDPEHSAGLYFEEYETEYYRPLVAAGGLAIANTWQALIDNLKLAVHDRTHNEKGRKTMVEKVAGTIDGNAAHRVADVIVEILNRGATSSPADLSNTGRSS